jgi:DNA-directed RNA polymerase specialized sigma24 family protein
VLLHFALSGLSEWKSVSDPQQSFDILLSWLDADRDAAGIKYENIRTSLIRIFISNGFDDAEDLADVVINRVTAKISDMIDTYVGEPTAFFFAVARNVAHEARRRKEIATDKIPETTVIDRATSDTYDCLVECLAGIVEDKRELILEYYLYEGKDKITHHRLMARNLGVTDGALRTRAHHIRTSLEKCVVKCEKRLSRKQKPTWGALLKRPGLPTVTSKERRP